MVALLQTAQRGLMGMALAAVAAVGIMAPVAGAVPLTNGGLLNSWETGDELQTEGWFGLTWNNVTDWYASFDAATHGSQSLRLTYTSAPPPNTQNFNWGARFESHSLAPGSAARVQWEAPWREAIADDRNYYSFTFDAIWRVKEAGKRGIPTTPTWANVAFALDWGAPDTSGGYSGFTQHDWGGIADAWVDRDHTTSGLIPLAAIIGQGNNTPIPADFHWIQMHFGVNGGWTSGEEATAYIDNVRIRLNGDANGDGRVDADDLALTDRGAALGLTGWQNGDFDLNGTAGTEADYLILDRSYARGNGGLPAALVADRQARFGADYVAGLVAAVPEPAGVGVLGAAVAGLLGRRGARRRA